MISVRRSLRAGHIFPFYTGFRGGKGFASYLGMTIALNWWFAVFVLIMVVITVVTDYIVLATTFTIFSVPAFMGFATGSIWPPLILLIATVVIAYKHRNNYVRICQGAEIGLRSTAKGEKRLK